MFHGIKLPAPPSSGKRPQPSVDGLVVPHSAGMEIFMIDLSIVVLGLAFLAIAVLAFLVFLGASCALWWSCWVPVRSGYWRCA